MALAFRSSTTAFSAAAAGASALGINVPAGVVDNDLLLAWFVFPGGALNTITPPAGWSLLCRGNASTSIAGALYYRIASSEPASYTWSGSQDGGIAGIMLAYSGPNTTGPFSVNSAQTYIGAGTTSLNSTGISDPGIGGEWLVSFFGESAAGQPWTAASGFTKRAENSAGNTPSTMGSDDAGGGAFGTQAATSSASTSVYVTAQVVIVPASLPAAPSFFAPMADDRTPRRQRPPAPVEFALSPLPITGLITDVNRLPAPDMSLCRGNARLSTPRLAFLFYQPDLLPPEPRPFTDLYPLPKRLRPLPFRAEQYMPLTTAEESRLGEWAFALQGQPRRPARSQPGLGYPYDFPQPPALALTWAPDVTRTPRRPAAVPASFAAAPLSVDSLSLDYFASAVFDQPFRAPQRHARADMQPPRLLGPEADIFGAWRLGFEPQPRRPGRTPVQAFRGPEAILPTEAGLDWQQPFAPPPRPRGKAAASLTEEAQSGQFWSLTPDVLITWTARLEPMPRARARVPHGQPTSGTLSPIPDPGLSWIATWDQPRAGVRQRTPGWVTDFSADYEVGAPPPPVVRIIVSGPYLVIAADYWFPGAEQGDVQPQ